MHVVPELGLGDDGVGREDDHSVGFRVWMILSGGFAAHHLVLTHKSGNSHCGYLKKIEKKTNTIGECGVILMTQQSATVTEKIVGKRPKSERDSYPISFH
mmetsp:Transcript_13321/g.25034  ORF Transcript_13321/g.25034 Transcript_13321/m.25034 type:complete len:100 (+) Transcript_13321:547-846(+)